jgi:hypothetical protein
MKGVLFLLGRNHSEGDAHAVMQDGFYGVWQKPPGDVDNWSSDSSGSTNSNQAGIFADLAALEEGDKVFFFTERKIYGIGELVSPPNASAPAVENYPGSLEPNPDPPDPEDAFYSGEDFEKVRVVFPFVPDPVLFAEGVDMDIALSAREADLFPYLRFLQGRNMTILTEEETRGLIRMLSRIGARGDQLTPTRSEQEFHQYLDSNTSRPFRIDELIADDPSHHLRDDGAFRTEFWIHGLLAEALKRNDERVLPDGLVDENRREVYREFPASPPKPPQYADSIDLVATKGNEFAEDLTVGYDIIEIKKDRATTSNFTRHITQVLKYVEYITEQYAGGDYGAVDAYYLAKGFKQSFIDEYEASISQGTDYDDGPTIKRHYILDAHEDVDPTIETWEALTLLEYDWNHEDDHLVISEADIDIQSGLEEYD